MAGAQQVQLQWTWWPRAQAAACIDCGVHCKVQCASQKPNPAQQIAHSPPACCPRAPPAGRPDHAQLLASPPALTQGPPILAAHCPLAAAAAAAAVVAVAAAAGPRRSHRHPGRLQLQAGGAAVQGLRTPCAGKRSRHADVAAGPSSEPTLDIKGLLVRKRFDQ